MAKNDFKAFATADSANVMSQQAYEALADRSSGFQSGVAKSEQLNKVWRQSSIMSAVLAQFIVDQTGRDAVDDGRIDSLAENLKAAVFNDATLTGRPTAPTPDASDSSTRVATTAFVQLFAGGNATQQWVREYGVAKVGDTMSGALKLPTVCLNQNINSDGEAAIVYNDPGRSNVVFRTGSTNAYKYSFIDENGVLTLPIRPTWSATPWDTENFDPARKLDVDGRAYSAARLCVANTDSVFNWAGQDGQPSWLWGGNDPKNMYLYNPSNFNVNHANTARSVGGVSAPAQAGAQCQRAGATQSFGVVSGNPMLPNPWVIVGLTGPGNATANAITVYGDWFRNQ